MRLIFLGVSSVGIANAVLGRVAIPAIPPTIDATFAKDSLREMSTLFLLLVPANALED